MGIGPRTQITGEYYYIRTDEVRGLQRVCRRLYYDTKRMDADEMRNEAQSIEAILDRLIEAEVLIKKSTGGK